MAKQDWNFSLLNARMHSAVSLVNVGNTNALRWKCLKSKVDTHTYRVCTEILLVIVSIMVMTQSKTNEIEQRVAIKCCFKCRKKISETFQMMQHDPSTKRETAEWRDRGRDAMNSKERTMLIAFFNSRGIIHPAPGRTMSETFYKEVLEHSSNLKRNVSRPSMVFDSHEDSYGVLWVDIS